MHELSHPSRLARLQFTASDFTILEMGDYVLCAVTQAPIALHTLCYWNADRQEAYANSHAAFLRECELENKSFAVHKR